MPEEASTVSGSGSEEKPCSSTAAADSSADVMEEAKKLIGTGKRHLVMGDVVSAVSVFQDACSMLAAKFGDTADECGEAFFLCGKSLLELARMENSVLGNALEGVPEESEEEEQPNNANIESADNLDEETREELRKQVYDAMAEEEKAEAADVTLGSKSMMRNVEVENENIELMAPVEQCASGSEEASSSPLNVEKCTKDAEQKSSCPEAEAERRSPQSEGEPLRGEDEGAEEPEEGKDETKPETDEGEDKSEGNDDDDDDDDDEEEGEKNAQDNEEDDVGNLQLAWEMLEVAKVIFTRKESKEEQLMAAQAYLKLGEVGAESGNYPQALDDFQECLSLQLKHLPPHSRLLAETHYHVATTLCYMDQYNQAIQHYNSSIKVIETRLAMLQEIIDAAKDAAAAEEKNEMEELKLLLPEIREKVEDAKESQRTASAASQAIQQTLGTASTSSAFLCENGGPSSSSSSTAFATTSQIPVKTRDGTSSSKASDISHLVRKKRKPEEGSPVKDTGAKQPKREATVNGSGESSASNRNEIQEGKSQPATQSASESST
ncbi:nuclear autoantigenic sperm protein isoform X2 [Nematolebias whitei]|uniref:nuclear autoantigenic sperm protein isoform X2 n=1 Tax=Nematolebias whitei TaxID=451745 RepID=UPI001898A227|nr:nuclear autoantigenic sperm protein isoform X2 [Nematolebias whitei]